MKTTRLPIVALSLLALGLSSCADDYKAAEGAHDGHDHGSETRHPHDHDGDGKPDHAPGEHGKEHDGHDHGDHEGHDHGDHEHASVEHGPNGGLMLTLIEPHAEIFVTPERKLWITFVDHQGELVAAKDQSVLVVAGDRSAPTTLSFVADGDKWVSENALPEGDAFDMVVRVKPSAEADTFTERMVMNLGQCEKCEHPKYACTCACDHDHDHSGHGHDHGEH